MQIRYFPPAVFVFCLLALNAAFAADNRLVLDRESSRVTFTGELDSMHAGGAFRDFNGAVLLNADRSAPVSITFVATLSTVTFTEGDARERVFLQTIVSALQNSSAKYSSVNVIKTSGRNFTAHGSMAVFGRIFDMNIPFTTVEASEDRMRVRGVLNDKGKVLPFEVPTLSGEFVGSVKFDLLFVKGR